MKTILQWKARKCKVSSKVGVTTPHTNVLGTSTWPLGLKILPFGKKDICLFWLYIPLQTPLCSLSLINSFYFLFISSHSVWSHVNRIVVSVLFWKKACQAHEWHQCDWIQWSFSSHGTQSISTVQSLVVLTHFLQLASKTPPIWILLLDIILVLSLLCNFHPFLNLKTSECSGLVYQIA